MVIFPGRIQVYFNALAELCHPDRAQIPLLTCGVFPCFHHGIVIGKSNPAPVPAPFVAVRAPPKRPGRIRPGHVARIESLLEDSGIESRRFDAVRENPTEDDVDACRSALGDWEADVIVGLGGGSSIDTAKSIAVMARNPGEYWDYINGGSGKGMDPAAGALPIVAITTTAGTGTEADPQCRSTQIARLEAVGVTRGGAWARGGHGRAS